MELHHWGQKQLLACGVNGVVYVGSQDHRLFALDVSTGEKLWSYQTGDIILASLAVADRLIYIGSHDGMLYAWMLKRGAKCGATSPEEPSMPLQWSLMKSSMLARRIT